MNDSKESICPYCSISSDEPISEQPEGKQSGLCPHCKTTHHVECWQINGGCTTFGCPHSSQRREGFVQASLQNIKQLDVASIDNYDLAEKITIVGSIFQLSPQKTNPEQTTPQKPVVASTLSSIPYDEIKIRKEELSKSSAPIAILTLVGIVAILIMFILLIGLWALGRSREVPDFQATQDSLARRELGLIATQTALAVSFSVSPTNAVSLNLTSTSTPPHAPTASPTYYSSPTPTEAQIPSPTNTATHTPTQMPTQPSATYTPTPRSPTHTLVPTPNCSVTADRNAVFYNLWNRHRAELGCPHQARQLGADTIYFVEQPFNNGHMFFFSSHPVHFVIVKYGVARGGETGNGAWQKFDSEPWTGGDENFCIEGQGLPYPIYDNFNRVWCANPAVRSDLVSPRGVDSRVWARETGADNSQHVLTQGFENGFILRDSDGAANKIAYRNC
jgi:hypothetical protein